MMDKIAFAQDDDGRKLSMDPLQLLRKHLLIVGQTGSGKTTSTLALVNQLQQANYTNIIFDPTGEYRSLPNAIVYRLGDNAYLDAGTLSAQQLCQALAINPREDLLEHMESAITALRIQRNLKQESRPYVKIGVSISKYQHQLEQLGTWASSYDPQLLGQQMVEEMIVPRNDEQADYTLLGQQYDRQAIRNSWAQLTLIRERLMSRAFRALFDPDLQENQGKSKTDLLFAIKMFLGQASLHRTLVIDLSALQQYDSSQRTVLSLLFHHLLLLQLHSAHLRPVNVVLDEAHRYLPMDQSQLAGNGIFQVLREGRKAQLSVTLTTQSPLDLPARLRSQFANVLIHRLAAPEELSALSSLPHNIDGLGQLTTGDAYLFTGEKLRKIHVIEPKWLR